jgi:acylphosphatase
MNDATCRRLRIRGVVQGVGFRYSLEREALRLGLTGWVRNRHDGSVEAMVAGTASAVEALVAWSHRGPPSARVERVEVSPGEGGFTAFEQRPTA